MRTTNGTRGFASGAVALASAIGALLLASQAQAVVLSTQLACQQAVSKAGRTYLEAVFKLQTRCRSAELAGKTGACTAADLKKSLADAASKHDARLVRPCGALPQDALVSPSPAGLSLAPFDVLGTSLRSAYDRIARALAEDIYPTGTNGGTVSAAALTCQTSLDSAVAKQLSTALFEVGSRCHDLEDRGKTVVDETSGVAEACLATATPKLAEAAKKTKPRCTDAAITELPAVRTCGSSTVAAITSCLLARADLAAGAALSTEHGRRGPRVRGRIETSDPQTGRLVNVPDAIVRLRDRDGVVVDEGRSGIDGTVDLHGRALESLRLCWERGDVVSCAEEPVTLGLDPAFFGSRKVAPPTGPGETVWVGQVRRSDDSPCLDGSVGPELAIRGGVTPIGKNTVRERFPVSTTGDFVAIGAGDASSLVADCGKEEIELSLQGLAPTTSLVLRGTNKFPQPQGIDVTDRNGTPLSPNGKEVLGSLDVVRLDPRFPDPEEDDLSYEWRVTSGAAFFVGTDGKPVDGDPRRTTGRPVELRLPADKTSLKRDEITVQVWASDGRGGIESLVLPIGPISVDIAPPCALIPKLQKVLCGTGYDPSVPEPAGGRANFLTYPYRHGTFNSPDDACLYYNMIDPQCIDLDCDGQPDPGTDPSGLCKRTTLGGFWEKNGFDPVTGLGPDVVSAWYLNSNDLGFGREMHCRVTSWRSPFLERPTDAKLVQDFYLPLLRSDLLSTSTSRLAWTQLLGKLPATIACYVVNYTTDFCFNYPTNDPQNADLAYQGQQSIVSDPTVDPLHAYGTVAMEFAPVEGFADLGPITKFFVYDGRLASGARLTAANLDGCGAKSVPEVCLNCHGGSWPGDPSQGVTLDGMIAGLTQPAGVLANIDANDTAAADAGYQLRRSILEHLTKNEPGFSSFLPFDPDTYQFPAAASGASQANSIRRLNQLVLYAKPTNPIRDLVRGWYGNNLASGTFGPWRPTVWNDDPSTAGNEADLYDDVYAVSCRGCHAAHFSFDPYFPGSNRVCKDGLGNAGSSPTMPHAKLTYLNLWKSDFPQASALPSLEAWYLAMEGGFTSCD